MSLSILTRIVDFILIGFAFLLIIQSALNETISIGLLTFYFTIVTSFSGGFLTSIIFSISHINEGQIRMFEMKKFLSRKPKIKDGNMSININIPPEIEFKKVYFKYLGSEKFVFKNFNLKIKAGEKIAIVGANGAGKTTLVKLIMRLYTVTSGELLINGTNISDLKLKYWYKQIGTLFQDYNTYPDLTAFDNIFIGRP
jgi:ABC-type multidrug transport system fused ATPase/permease subunit